MQYILSEEEFKALKGESDSTPKINLNRAQLQGLCTRIADTMPVTFWGRKTPRPWGCIITNPGDYGCCDECPVIDICPNDYKEWSK